MPLCSKLEFDLWFGEQALMNTFKMKACSEVVCFLLEPKTLQYIHRKISFGDSYTQRSGNVTERPLQELHNVIIV